MNGNRWLGVGVVVAALALGGVAGCSRTPGPVGVATAVSIPVSTVPVVYSTLAVPIEATGILSRQAEAELSFKSGGVVGEVMVRAGESVRKGQVLARLKLDEIEALVIQARANRDKATRDVVRARQLLATQVYTLEQVQNVETQEEQATAALRSAEFNARHAVIEAPSDGVILRRRAEPNQTLAAGTPVLDFGTDAEGWLVRVGLSDRDILRVRVGDAADWSIETPGTVSRGIVAHIAEASDSPTRTTEVEIRVNEVPPGLRSGFLTHVTLHPRPVEPRPWIPASAIVEGQGDSAVVFLVDGTVARRVPVVADGWFAGRLFLRTQLPTGASLVVAGAEFLRDGMPVRVENGLASIQ